MILALISPFFPLIFVVCCWILLSLCGCVLHVLGDVLRPPLTCFNDESQPSLTLAFDPNWLVFLVVFKSYFKWHPLTHLLVLLAHLW